MLRNNLVVLSIVFVAGCTQAPAKIEMKGQQSFTRNQANYNSPAPTYNSTTHYNSNASSSSSGYTSIPSTYSAPVSEATESKASVSSIGISDLAPPPKSAAKAEQPAQQDTQVQDMQADEAGTSEPINTPNTTNTAKKKTGGMKPVVKTTINPWTNKPRSSNDEISSPDKMPFKIAKKDKKEPLKTIASSELKWPTASKKILSSFGVKGAGKANDGINIAAENGSPVWAAADGQVVYVKNNVSGYGNLVLIKHSGDRFTSYAHLDRIAVKKYAKVAQGEVVGYVGTTGNVKTPQLFFALHKDKEAVDPQKYLSNQFAGL